MNPYKAFPNANLIKEWDKLLKLSREEVEELSKAWVEIHRQNEVKSKEIFNKKLENQEEIDAKMIANNLDIFTRKRGGFPKIIGYKAWYKKNVVDVISEKYPSYKSYMPVAHIESQEVNGIVLRNHQSPTRIVELYETISRDYRAKINTVQLTDKLLIESIKYANSHNIDIEELGSKDIIQIVDDFAKAEYKKQNLPDGTELYLKHGCYECSAYFVGERRCSCGNRRIMVVIEGNLIEGYEYSLEAY